MSAHGAHLLSFPIYLVCSQVRSALQKDGNEENLAQFACYMDSELWLDMGGHSLLATVTC